MSYDHLRSEAIRYDTLEVKFKWWDWFYTYLVLPFNMQPQTQSNWCWAATSTSVSKFYSFFSPWTQCKVAGAELSQTCCASPVPSPCNVPWYLDRALTRTQNFVSYQGGTITWQRVKQELENGLVVGTRIGWSGGGGHFMTIHGVSRIGLTEYLHIDDPIYGKSVLTYNQFATNYQGSGTWTHTYFTKKHFYFMWFKDLVFERALLKPIPELKPLRRVYDKPMEAREPVQEGSYNIPHHAYLIGLDEVKRGFRMPSQPRSLRVVEMQEENPVALYEVGLNPEQPELIQMQVSEAYFNQINEGLGRLKGYAEKAKQPGELRFVKVPALNLEAWWMHYDGDAKDVFVPVKRFENETSVDWNKVYDEQSFTQLVQELSRKVNADDDQLGAGGGAINF